LPGINFTDLTLGKQAFVQFVQNENSMDVDYMTFGIESGEALYKLLRSILK